VSPGHSLGYSKGGWRVAQVEALYPASVYPAILYGDDYFLRSRQITWENARADFTYEKACEIRSEQLGILVRQAWQGGALPLSYTRSFEGETNNVQTSAARNLLIAAGGLK
jgi:hypothetical protein